MSDDFWHNLKADFLRLRTDTPMAPSFRLYSGDDSMDGVHDTGALAAIREGLKEWVLCWQGQSYNAIHVRRFVWLAERAVARLGFNGTGLTAVSSWLDRIASDAPEALTVSEASGQALFADVCYWSAHYCDKCVTLETSRAGESVPPHIAGQAVRDGGSPLEHQADTTEAKTDQPHRTMASRQDILTKLLQGATDYPRLSARWHSKERRWTLYSEGTDGFDPADPEAERAFKDVARAALAFVGRPAGLVAAWSVWLDSLREGNRGFLRIKKIREGYWHVASRCDEEGSEYPERAYRLLEDGTISGIFRESAELFEDIAPSPDAAREPKADEASGKDPAAVSAGSDGGVARRAAVDAYIQEVFVKTGTRITRTDIWKRARYKSRTEFERWERNDLKHQNKTADKRFTQILTEKPHLKELSTQGHASPRIAPR
jgi:hypothetical protein